VFNLSWQWLSLILTGITILAAAALVLLSALIWRLPTSRKDE
jgi:hypothetical protein